MAKKKKFKGTWGNQTEIGRAYNMSAVALGKFLIEQGLKSAATKEPTNKALADGFAISTPLKDERAFFMWNRKKVGNLLDEVGVGRASTVDFHVSRIVASLRGLLRETGNDKMDWIAYGMYPDEIRSELEKVNQDIRVEVGARVVAELKRLGLVGKDEPDNV